MKAVLFILLCIIAVVSTSAGLLMIIHPDGSTINLSPGLLEGTPFKDFAIPGVILILAVGVVNLISLYYAIDKNTRAHYNMSLAGGALLATWAFLQMLVFQSYNWILFGSLLIGIGIMLIALQLKGKWVV